MASHTDFPSSELEKTIPTDKLHAAANHHRIPLDTSSELFKAAKSNNLGERMTVEFLTMHEGQPYRVQQFEKGFVYAPIAAETVTVVTDALLPFDEQPQVRDANGAATEIAAAASFAAEAMTVIPWNTKMTGFKGNRWQYWAKHMRGKIDGLKWKMFMEGMAEQNPHLVKDGFLIKRHKTYRIPGEQDITINHNRKIRPPSSEFIRAKDGKFYLEGDEFRALGINIRGLLHYGYDNEYFRHAPRWHKKHQLNAARKLGARIIRVFLPHKDAAKEEIESRLHDMLYEMKRHYPEMRLLPALTNLYNDVPFYVRSPSLLS